MTIERTPEQAGSAAEVGARIGCARKTTAQVPGALTAGSKAFGEGVLALCPAVCGFGREVLAEAGRHVWAAVEAKNLHDLAELQAASVQQPIELGTPHAKEFADLARSTTEEVIAPFVALVKAQEAA